jgi:acetyl-CoA synthetase
MANALAGLGLKKGDRVAIYMPMVPEAAIAMLACARLGVIHTVIFGGFSSEAIKDRRERLPGAGHHHRRRRLAPRQDRRAQVERRPRAAGTPSVERVIVLKRTGQDVPMVPDRDIWWHDAVAGMPALRTRPRPSGASTRSTSSTRAAPPGSPRASCTRARATSWASHDDEVRLRPQGRRRLFLHRRRRLGHRPQLRRLRTAVGGRDRPHVRGRAEPSRAGPLWELIDRHQATILYTAPTAIRAFMRWGDDYVNRHARLAAPARLRRRADQSRRPGCGTTP